MNQSTFHRWYLLPILISSIVLINRSYAQRDEFDQTLQEWKDTFKKLAEVQREFLTCEESEIDAIRDRWRATKAQGDALASQLVDRAIEVYETSNIDTPEIKELLEWQVKHIYETGNYRKSALIGKALLRHDPDNEGLVFDTIKSAFFDNEYELALQLIRDWKERGGEMESRLKTLAEYIEMYQTEWQREVALREREKTGNLPVLELETGKGRIVIELFEEQAPNAVNCFVFLVETGFYKDMTFFEVFEHQYALTGCPANNGTQAAGLGVESEANLPEARKHFRGTVSLRVDPQDNAARSQFYLLRVPMPDFDGQHVAVGRVIEGIDVVDQLTATFEFDNKFNPVPVEDATADLFLSIKVLKKRDHEYRPDAISQ